MLDVRLVQQGAWDMPIDSMPLAAGYLKATLDSVEEFRGEVATAIHSFRGGQLLQSMAGALFAERIPDVLAFSVLGWNYRSFGALAETFKQLNPDGVVVFGGNHVAYQGDRVFRELPWVDVVVNGEGELTFPDLVRHLLARPGGGLEPADVRGLSFRRPDGTVHSTPERDRIMDLDSIPSPFLTGAIGLTDRTGGFRYDVALMETNRGCPYKCAFCYWGGAVGQKVRPFALDRLEAELDLFGYHEAPAVVLCDANFGLLERDQQFVELLVKTREKYGHPHSLVTSWAKNKSQRFFDIVRQLKRHGLHSLFTLALQTLDDEALEGMNRRNMRLNQWESLVDALQEEGLECYAELIWGAPGETPESFLEGYDRMARRVSRIAVYPMLLLPNTSYMQRRELHGFVTVRGERDDFEYVLANRTSSVADNLRIQQFVFWARVLGEQQYLRHVWRPLLDLAGMTQSAAIGSLRDHFDASADDPAVAAFLRDIPVLAESPAVAAALRSLHTVPELEGTVRRWWDEVATPLFPLRWRPFARDLYEFERWSRPVYVAPGEGMPPGWRVDTGRDEPIYRSELVTLAHDVPGVLLAWSGEPGDAPAADPTMLTFTARPGYHDNLDNHESAARYLAVGRRAE